MITTSYQFNLNVPLEHEIYFHVINHATTREVLSVSTSSPAGPSC
ncbi:hypothetical protein [Williamsia sp.]